MSTAGFEDFGKITECVQNGQDANGLLDDLSRSERRDFAKFLREGQSEAKQNGTTFLPELTITINNRGLDFDQKGPFPNGTCGEISKAEDAEENVKTKNDFGEIELYDSGIKSDRADGENEGQFDYLAETFRSERQEQRVEDISSGIEETADKCMDDDMDHGSKLELRKKLMNLKKETPATKEAVMRKLEEHYGKGQSLETLPFVGDLVSDTRSGMDVTYAKDADGNDIKSEPLEIRFKGAFNNGDAQEVIYMDKSLVENAEIARERFQSSGDVMGTAGSKQRYELDKQLGNMPEEKLLWFDRVLK